MFMHACPECGVDLVACSEDLIAEEVFLCEECDTRWAVCPDCGELVDADADEDWNVEQGVCRCCQISEDDAIELIGLIDDPMKMFACLEQLFGEPEPPAH